jgi:hypothetical protein
LTVRSNVGVYGESRNNCEFCGGVYGFSPTSGGVGVVGVANNGGTATGVYGVSSSGWAGFFKGDVYVTGTLYGGLPSLRIDDPVDPTRRYLQHAGIASSEQLDLYSGNVVTDGKGFATVRLPRWFQALNRSFRYQLTVIGKTHWDAKAAVWDEIAHNRFTIRTDQPSVTVSWQVTAVRHDPYANAHRSGVEIRKSNAEQGKYLHPELYGKPKREAIGYAKPPRPPRVPSQKR